MAILAVFFPKGRWTALAGSLNPGLVRGIRTAALRLAFAITKHADDILPRSAWDFILTLVKRYGIASSGVSSIDKLSFNAVLLLTLRPKPKVLLSLMLPTLLRHYVFCCLLCIPSKTA